MKKQLLLALILLIVITGLPLALGMGAMESCPSCPAPDAAIAFAMCFVILAFGLMTIVLRSTRVFSAAAVLKPLLFATGLERPPRAA